MNQEMKEHISQGINTGMRMDGRKADEFRKITIETGKISTAEGSAILTCGEAKIIAGVKLGMGKPFPDTPEEGVLMVNAELLPMSNPEFEPGPPSIESIETSRVIDRGIREGHAMDVKKLCIEPGEKVWMVNVDVCPVNYDGNLIDLGALAAMAALRTAVYPKIVDGKVDYHQHTKDKLPLENIPLPVTVFKIGGNLVVDPTQEEQKASEARLTVGFIAGGKLCSMQKHGGTLMVEEIKQMVSLARKKSDELRKILEAVK